MIYLAAQFAWFLLAAFALGLAMGWISHDGGRLRLGGPLVLGLAGAWALGGALTWTQTLNGTAALWVESALLFIAVYALGCILGSVICARSSLQAAPAGASPAMAPGPASAWASCGAGRRAGQSETDQRHRRSERGEAAGAGRLAFQPDRGVGRRQCRLGRFLPGFSRPDRARGLGRPGAPPRRRRRDRVCASRQGRSRPDIALRRGGLSRKDGAQAASRSARLTSFPMRRSMSLLPSTGAWP